MPKNILIVFALLLLLAIIGIFYFGSDLQQLIRAFEKRGIFTASLAENTVDVWPAEGQENTQQEPLAVTDTTKIDVAPEGQSYGNWQMIDEEEFPSQQDQIDDLLEIIDSLKAKIAALTLPSQVNQIEEVKEDLIKEEDIKNSTKDEVKQAVAPTENAKSENLGSGQAIYPKILISEIEIEGVSDSKEEFVELYNPNNEEVDLTGWYVQRRTKASASFSTYAPSTLFAGKKIVAHGYFIIARDSSGIAYNIAVSHPLTYDNVLVIKNPNGEVSDKLGLGDAKEYETKAVQNPLPGQSIGRKFIDGSEIDSDDNSLDFEVQNPTPYAQNVAYVALVVPENDSLQTVSELKKVAINQIQISGNSASDEFVELYNPNEFAVDMAGFSLKKKTSSATESNLVSAGAFVGVAKARGFFLIGPQVGDNGNEQYMGTVTLDLRYSGKSFSIASDNTVLLYDKEGRLLDKVGFGAAQDFEGSLTVNPNPNYSIARKVEGQDSDDNGQDFITQASTPKNTVYVAPVPQNPDNSDSQGSIDQTSSDVISPVFDVETLPVVTPDPLAGEFVTPSISSVVISEIAWMGTSDSANNEWIELYNFGTEIINLSGWSLEAGDGVPVIALSGSINANSFYLLERTSDNTLPSVSAHQIYTGALGNAGEHLYLYDSLHQIIDEVNCASGWFAGDNVLKQTMQRKSPALSGSSADNWQTGASNPGSAS